MLLTLLFMSMKHLQSKQKSHIPSLFVLGKYRQTPSTSSGFGGLTAYADAQLMIVSACRVWHCLGCKEAAVYLP